ncbi:hypothetical protein [Pseudooceanicola sp. LIPI14-2-Ac024]|uniref:hypothetical protein n=1 Tax=Pseudooceanicola sp. LIPI14-2-Ac024 TaxID=3344875 RepID=UPI0035D03CAB
MRFLIPAAGAAVVAISLTMNAAQAGPISRACLSSDRAGGNSALCGCIQSVANMTLNGSDQARAAQFFTQPDLAETVRMSKASNDSTFWQRYEQFGQIATATCS